MFRKSHAVHDKVPLHDLKMHSVCAKSLNPRFLKKLLIPNITLN